MAGIKIKVAGLQQLGERMRGLAEEMNNKIARSATAAAANVIKKEAKRRAPVAPEAYVASGEELVKVKGQKGKSRASGSVVVQPGNIAKNIISKRIGKSGTLTSEHIVAVRGKKKYGYAKHIATLQEYGTVNQPAQPFMRPAMDTKHNDAIEAMRATIEKGIERGEKGGTK